MVNKCFLTECGDWLEEKRKDGEIQYSLTNPDSFTFMVHPKNGMKFSLEIYDRREEIWIHLYSQRRRRYRTLILDGGSGKALCDKALKIAKESRGKKIFTTLDSEILESIEDIYQALVPQGATGVQAFEGLLLGVSELCEKNVVTTKWDIAAQLPEIIEDSCADIIAEATQDYSVSDIDLSYGEIEESEAFYIKDFFDHFGAIGDRLRENGIPEKGDFMQVMQQVYDDLRRESVIKPLDSLHDACLQIENFPKDWKGVVFVDG